MSRIASWLVVGAALLLLAAGCGLTPRPAPLVDDKTRADTTTNGTADAFAAADASGYYADVMVPGNETDAGLSDEEGDGLDSDDAVEPDTLFELAPDGDDVEAPDLSANGFSSRRPAAG